MKRLAVGVSASLLLPAMWIAVKYGFAISDRYLPSPTEVFRSINDPNPSLLVHIGASWLRLATGFILGVVGGIGAGVLWWRSPAMDRWSNPSVQALRAVPPTATIPFFLLWFGFAELGRVLLIFLGIALNVAIAARQILRNTPQKYLTALRSAGLANHEIPVRHFAIPLVLESILPTLRFALSTSIGLVVVSEILGSQVGLGYLIQSARSTFALQMVFLAAIAFGLINVVSDKALCWVWQRAVFWRQMS